MSKSARHYQLNSTLHSFIKTKEIQLHKTQTEKKTILWL